jgi:hypothetical protein
MQSLVRALSDAVASANSALAPAHFVAGEPLLALEAEAALPNKIKKAEREPPGGTRWPRVPGSRDTADTSRSPRHVGRSTDVKLFLRHP